MEKKANWQAFKKILDQHGITKLYHFTDRANLESIIKHGGLYSWADCESRGITIPKPGGSDTSHDLDRRDGLQNYVRVSFTPEHPMMYVAKDDGRISDPVVLEIDPEVIYWKGSKYADRNATKTEAMVGGALDNFKRIHFSSVKAHKHFELPEDEQQFFQAEVLVKNFIPLKFIKITLNNITYIDLFHPSCEVVHSEELEEVEHLTTKVTDEDIQNGVEDEYGAIYSTDGKRLLWAPDDIVAISIQRGTKTIGNNVFQNCKYLTTISIPNSVTSIGSGAFEGCSSLTKLTIPNSVKKIGDSAFANCDNLSSVSIPNSVTKIGYNAFGECDKLKSIIVERDNPKYDSRGNCNAIIETSTNTLISGCKNSIIPHSVTKIGRKAFNDCSGLANITIPNSVTDIGFDAFKDCTGLKSVHITSLTNWCYIDWCYEDDIVFNPLRYATNLYINGIVLKDLTIPKTVKFISDYAFYYYKGLTKLSIPKTISEIGKEAFTGCSGLNSIVIEKGNRKYDSRDNSNAIIETATNTLIVGCKNSIIPPSVTKIGDSAFANCDGLTNIVIPDSVNTIGNNAFNNCRCLTHITIPRSVTNIMKCAFSGYKGLEYITVNPNNSKYDSRNNSNAIIETATNTLIIGCKNTIIPNSVTKIGDFAFMGCLGLNSITIPDSINRIGIFAFWGCQDLTNITIPNSVTVIDEGAFDKCSRLTVVLIPESVKHIGEHAFDGCINLKFILIPKGTKKKFKRLFNDSNISQHLIETDDI